MSKPTENPNKEVDKAKTAGPKEQAPTSPDTDLHEQLKDQTSDNVELLKALEKLTPKERQKLLDQASQWEKNGDLDQLRAAGLSLNQLKKSPLDRHVKLASMFLKRLPASDSLTFQCDFMGNDYAETNADLSDIMPCNVLKVDVYDVDHNLLFENAERGFKDGKPGYFDAKGEQVFLRDGFQIKVKATQSSAAMLDLRKGRQTNDHALKEQVYLTENEQKTQLKKKAQTEAAKQGKTLITDNKFYDKAATEVTRSPKLEEFFKDGKFDFSKILDQIKKFVEDFGVMLSQGNLDFTKAFDAKEQAKQANPQDPKSVKSAAEDKHPTKDSLITAEYLRLPPDERDRKVVETARSFIGSKDFRGADVAGGNLACAKVASTILKQSGVLSDVVYNVDAVESALLRKGWQKHSAPAASGDVAILGRTPSTLVDGIAKPGHKHVGIVTGAVSGSYSYVNNNSGTHMPNETKLDVNNPRGVYFLSPPHRNSATSIS